MRSPLELSRFQRFIDNKMFFLILFFILTACGILVDYYTPLKTMSGIYTLMFITMSFAVRKIWMQVILVGLLMAIKNYLSPDGFVPFDIFLFNWFSTLCMTVAITKLFENRLFGLKAVYFFAVSLSNALDSRDPYTARHSEHVARYGQLIAEQMGYSRKQCRRVFLGGLLHDIGKIGVPESILTKNSRLTDEEFTRIKEHPVIGYKMVRHVNYLQSAGVLDMIKYHHERFDGAGYPEGLSGTDIPKLARIIAVADSFDAMTSRRVYRAEYDFQYALQELRKNRGKQFDPDVVDAFLQIVEQKGPELLRTVHRGHNPQETLVAAK